jgi:hypothetical protein
MRPFLKIGFLAAAVIAWGIFLFFDSLWTDCLTQAVKEVITGVLRPADFLPPGSQVRRVKFIARLRSVAGDRSPTESQMKKPPNPESCVHPERCGAVNTTIGEQARGGPETKP